MLVWQAHRSKIRSLSFSADGRFIATTDGVSQFVWLWEASTGRRLRMFHAPGQSIHLAAFHPDARHVVGQFRSRGGCAWNLATGEVVAEYLTDQWLDRDTLAVSPTDGRVVAHVSNGLSEWTDMNTPSEAPRRSERTRSLPPGIIHYPLQIAFSPTGRFLCFLERNLTLADPVSLRPLRTLVDPRGANASVVAFTPDESRIAVAFGHRAAVWKLDHLLGRPLLLRGHSLLVRALGFLPGGEMVLSAGMDGTARLWDTNSGSERRAFDWGIGKIRVAAVSPDGLTCAAGGDGGQIVVWDVDA